MTMTGEEIPAPPEKEWNEDTQIKWWVNPILRDDAVTVR